MPRVRSSSAELVFDIAADVDVAVMQSQCRAWCRQVGASSTAEWAIAIAASEAATNMLKYGGGGRLTFSVVGREPRSVQFEAVDRGVGIAEPEEAVRDHVSQGRDRSAENLPRPPASRGTGLGAIERLMDSLVIESDSQRGTRLIATKRLV